MMKNSEWSAVAYLSQSIYGKYGNKDYSGAYKEIYKNDSSSYYTGRSQGLAPTTSSYSSAGTCKYNDVTNNGSGRGQCGPGASTTGNIYGVYDMSGGAYEYVMGNYKNIVFNSGFETSWFITLGNEKYYDKFTTATPGSTKLKETMGQAYVETAGWYSDNNNGSLSTSYPWVSRGSYYDSTAGAFSSSFTNGHTLSGPNSPYSFRSVLATIES